jgi:hypothetical protein
MCAKRREARNFEKVPLGVVRLKDRLGDHRGGVNGSR